MIVNLIGF